MTSLAPINQAVTTLNKSIISSIVDTVKDYTNDETNQLTLLESKYDFQNKAKSNIDDLQKLLTEYKGDTIQYSDLVLPKLKSFQSEINEKIGPLNKGDKQLVNDFTDMWNLFNTNTISDADKYNHVKILLEKNDLVKLPNIPLSIKNGGGLLGAINKSRDELSNIVTDFISKLDDNKKYYDIVQLNNKNSKEDRITQYAFVYYDYSDANIKEIKKYHEKIIEYDDNVDKTLTSAINSIYHKINNTDMRGITNMSEKISSMLLDEIDKTNHDFRTKYQSFIDEIKEIETKLDAKIYFFNDKLETLVLRTNPQNDEQALTEIIGPYECVVDINFYNHTINDIILNYEVDSKIIQLNDQIVDDETRSKKLTEDNKQNNIRKYTEQKSELTEKIAKYEREINAQTEQKQTMMTKLNELKQNVNFTKHDVLELLSTQIIGGPKNKLYQEVFGDKTDYNKYFENQKALALVDAIINKKYSDKSMKDSVKTLPKYQEIISKAETLDNIEMLEKDIQTIEDKINKLNTSIINDKNGIIKLAEKIKNPPVQNYAVDDSKKNILENLKIVKTTGGISIQKLLSNFSISPKNELNTYTFPYDWIDKPIKNEKFPETIKNNQSIQIVKDSPFFVTNQLNIENIFTYGDKKGQINRSNIKSKVVDILTKKHGNINNDQWILDTAWNTEDEKRAMNISLSIFSKNFNSLIVKHNEILDSIWSKNVNSIVFTEMKKMVEQKSENIKKNKETLTTSFEQIMANIASEIKKEQNKIDKQKTTRGALGLICFIVFATLFIYLIDYSLFGGAITQGLSNVIIDIIIFLLSPIKEFWDILWKNTPAAAGKTALKTGANLGIGAFNFVTNWGLWGKKEDNWVQYYEDTSLKDATNAVVSEMSMIHFMLLIIYAAIGILLYTNGPDIKKMISDNITKWFSQWFDRVCKIPLLNKVLPCEETSIERKTVMELVNTKLNDINDAQNTAEMQKILKKLSEESINKESVELSGIELGVFKNLLNNLETTKSDRNLETTNSDNVVNTMSKRGKHGFFNQRKKTSGGSKLSKKNKHKRINIASKRRPVKLKKMRRTKKMRGGANPEIDIIITSFMAFINNIIELVLYGKTSTIDQANYVIEMVLNDSNSFTSFFDILYKCFTNIRIPVSKKKEEYARTTANQTRKQSKDKND